MKPKKDVVAKRARDATVRQTGKIPPGTCVHHRHIRNLPAHSIFDYIEATRASLAAGTCHVEWASKRLAALYSMLDAKQAVVEKRRASRRRIAR